MREEAHDEAREERKPRTDAHELERQLQPRGGGGRRRRLGKRVRAAFGTSRWKEVWAMSCGCSALARLVRACMPQRPSRA